MSQHIRAEASLSTIVEQALTTAADCLAALDAYSPGESADKSERRVRALY